MTDVTILGIDGGGSKTIVAMADRNGKVTALVRGKPTSPLESDGWREALEQQVRPFVGRAGLASVAAALPAYGEVEHVSAMQRRVMAELFGPVPQRVLNDVDAAHLGAFAGGPGVLILSGTGSMAWARDEAGLSHRTGGWGDVVGDEGSGYWIGRRILEAVSKSSDGRGKSTGLVSALYKFLELDGADPISQLEGWASSLGNPRTEIAALAPLATGLAEAGDGSALAIIGQAADELAAHVKTLERKLAAPSLGWSFAGGMFASVALRQALIARIGRPPRPPRLPPIGGALLAAAQHLGWQLDEGWIERLAASIGALHAGAQEPNQHTRETGNA